MGANKKKESVIRTWVWIFVMLLIIGGKGLYAFFVISDKGMPTWDYRTVQDVPAASPYAVYTKLPTPQHVRGTGGE